MITRRERAETSKKAGNALDGEVKKAVNDLIDEVKKSPASVKRTATKAPAGVKKVASAKGVPVKTVGAKAMGVKKTAGLNGRRMDFVRKGNVEELNRKLEEAKKEEKPIESESTAEKPVLVTKRMAAVTKKTATKKPTVKKPAVQKPVVLKEPGFKLAKKAPKQPPLVSVIIPVHNGARYIDSTIHSVLGQTFSDFELIIVDDYSEDQTLKVISEFSSDKILTVYLDHKSGMAEARNAGVKKASGRYICFLNARDMWQPEKLEIQIEFMQEKNAAFSYTGYVYSDENGIPSGKAVRVPAEISGLQASRVSSILVSTVMLDLSKLTKDDIMMPVSVRNPKTATWQKILKKTSRAYGLNEVLTIRAYDHKAPLWKKVWRRV